MRIRRRAEESAFGIVGRPAKNQIKRNMYIFGVVVLTAVLILWVYGIGKKAEQTVEVVMLNQNVYKNQVITEAMLKPYDMIQGEFEKYAVVDSSGRKARRIVLWEERDKIINTFAAFPIQRDTYAEYRSFIKSRIENKDNVLYSFPGKEVIPLEIENTDLQAFKTFLQPGDRINIEAIFSQNESVANEEGLGGTVQDVIEVFKTENVFKDIMIADLLNQQGESILDVYESYRSMTAYEQAELDVSQAFKEKTEPTTLLVALTPEEKERYYYYLSKDQIKLRVSMPQRVE